MSRRPVRLFVDATPLAADALTGVGHVLVETVTALLAPEFADRVEVVLVMPASERAAVARHAPAGARLRSLPLPRRLYGLLTRTPFPIDLLVGRGVYFFPNFRNWRTVSPSITFLHDVCFAVEPALVPAGRRRMLSDNVPRWLARTSLVATGTPSAAREITAFLGVEESRITVLPTTVDAAVFRPRPESERAAAAALLEVGRYVLFVGSIEPRKNLAHLVRSYAAADLPAGHTLLLVGASAWDDADVRAELDRAVASGVDARIASQRVSDALMPALMSGADAVVLVSLHEGFGLPALEAVATGTPVIASDIAGIHDALSGLEDAAVFVDPRSQPELVAALEDAVRAPRRVEPGPVRPWSDAASALVRAAEELTAVRRRSSSRR
ncbi:glycosyltransferase family 1 protein [Rathayibacter festucae]|uniref:glycosyltransferase family 4 protein n=1 Tax=Rathayibacter festucae TaxID=110937 RepID=UPI002A6B49CD|nr:glycosyltransferase family 1 protein [Rathayibacter festucae]MDY0911421.1 glycosyltransferase family 1 protein [Rathayibacter festucae]